MPSETYRHRGRSRHRHKAVIERTELTGSWRVRARVQRSAASSAEAFGPFPTWLPARLPRVLKLLQITIF